MLFGCTLFSRLLSVTKSSYKSNNQIKITKTIQTMVPNTISPPRKKINYISFRRRDWFYRCVLCFSAMIATSFAFFIHSNRSTRDTAKNERKRKTSSQRIEYEKKCLVEWIEWVEKQNVKKKTKWLNKYINLNGIISLVVPPKKPKKT